MMLPLLNSKLPGVGTTIFTTMSALAAQYDALNLSQGFPDYAVNPVLIELIARYMHEEKNQYAPMAGVLALRRRISEKYQRVYDLDVDAETEITVTAGGTQAIFTAIAALVRPGDEVVIFEPAYDCYAPVVTLFGGKVVPVRLYAPDFAIDWAKVKAVINKHTRLIIINNPNNPSAKVLSRDDMQQLATLVTNSQAFVLSDEVYEHLVYDNRQPCTVLSYPLLRERSLVVASFGKLLHATGWKVGYCVSAPALMAEFRKIHQFNVFSVHTPTQWAIADYLTDAQTYLNLPAFFQHKRDLLAEGLRHSRFTVLPSQGTYFMNLDYSNISDLPEAEFAVELVKQHHIAAIPLSAFYLDGLNQHCLRLCFAKKEDTLIQAIKILNGV